MCETVGVIAHDVLGSGWYIVRCAGSTPSHGTTRFGRVLAISHLGHRGTTVVMIRGNARAVAALVVGALFVGACGGDGAESTTTTTTTEPTTTSTAPTTTTTLATTTTTSTTTPAVPATATTYVVQTDLTALGYFSGVIDGIAGDETRAAIAKFQSDAGIEADGDFGPVTDAALFPLLQEDVPYVESVQETLADLEFYTGPIDGDFGRGTQAAVGRFQESCDLEPTGELDIATRLCLFEV